MLEKSPDFKSEQIPLSEFYFFKKTADGPQPVGETIIAPDESTAIEIFDARTSEVDKENKFRSGHFSLTSFPVEDVQD